MQWISEQPQPPSEVSFSIEELILVAHRAPKEKTPGPDYVLDEILIELVKLKLRTVLSVFNECLDPSIFSKS